MCFKATFAFCFRLKDIIFKERSSKVQLEVMVHKLQSEIKKLTIELIKARDQQEDHIRHLRTLEKALEKVERQKGQQQAAQVPPLSRVSRAHTHAHTAAASVLKLRRYAVNAKGVRLCAEIVSLVTNVTRGILSE